MSERYTIDAVNKTHVLANGRFYCDARNSSVAQDIAAALNAQAGVVEAARRYYEGWCQDEASDEPEDGSDRCRWTGCTVEQRDAARALRDALAAVKGVES